MLRAGSIAVMILVSVALLGGLVAAGPLFGSATGAGGLARRLATIPETDSPAHRPVVQVTVHDGPAAESEGQIRALVDRIPYLGNGQTTLFGDSWHSEPSKPQPYVLVGGLRLPAVLYFRTGALAGLQVVSGTPGAKGLWLPEGTAKDLGVKAGSKVQVGKTYRWVIGGCGQPFFKISGAVDGKDTKAKITVAGTYRTGADGRMPLGSYFSRISSTLPSDTGFCPTPALMLVGDRPTIDAALGQTEEQPSWTYQDDLTPLGQSPANLRLAAAGAADLRLQAAQPSSPISVLMTAASKSFQIDSGLPAIHRQADADAAAARQQGRGIAYAGGILGLAAVVVALRALAQRRRRETELLLGLGTPTSIVVAAGTIELVLPAVIGAAIGFGVACLAFSHLGPHPELEAAAVGSAALGAVLVAGVALLSNALVTLGQARQISRSLSGLPASRFGSQWLPLLTGATVLAVIATLTRERSQSYQDPLAALLPILVLACGCSIIVRVAGGIAGLLQRRRATRPPVPQKARPESRREARRTANRLVLRGLRGTGVAVADLVIVLSIGVGVLAYGLLSASVVNQSVTDKAAVLAGAPSSAHVKHSWLLGGGEGPSPRLGSGTTMVWRAAGVLTPDNKAYDVLVVDPASLRTAASWGSGSELAAAKAALADFGTPTAASIAADKQNHAPVPALLVGATDRQAGTTAQLQVGFVVQPIDVRRHLAAFPGAVRPTVVLDARSFFPRLKPADNPSRNTAVTQNYDTENQLVSWVWSQASLPSLRQRMAGHGISSQEVFSLTQARAAPVLASSRWAASYQVLLGIAAVMLAGLAVVVAVDRRVARAAPVDLMLKRFGISSSRLLLLRTVELALTAVAALLVLAGPLAVMVVLLPRLVEPDPALPPQMPVHVTVLPLLFSAGVAVAVTAVAALAAARRSAALKPGEVLRDDT
jgi:putative ABC transport system permease protein